MNKLHKVCYLAFIMFATSILPSSVLAVDHATIMVTIKPFYNICARVMQDVGTPDLLLHNNASPHDYHLKPSDIKLIDQARLIIWGGAELETYLSKPLENIQQNKVLNLATVKGLNLLPLRTAANWEPHSHDHSDHNHSQHNHCKHDHKHDHHQHAESNMFDPHYWLDPDNAILIANAMALSLSEIDPNNAQIYRKNASNFAKEIKVAKVLWKQKLGSAQKTPYVVFHDAYQYYDKYFSLDGIGAISLNPEIPPSVQRIQHIQNLLATKQVVCIFSEPQFSNKIIMTLTNGMQINIGMLDPLGQEQDIGTNGYITMMDKITEQFVLCGANV